MEFEDAGLSEELTSVPLGAEVGSFGHSPTRQ